MRHRYELTQEELGRRAGTSRAWVSTAETALRKDPPNISRQMLRAWGLAFGKTERERQQNAEALLRAAGYATDPPSPEEAAADVARLDQALRRAIREELRPGDAGGDPPDLGPVLVGFARAHHILPAEKYRQLVALITNQVPMVTDLLARGELGPTRYRSDQPDDDEAG